MIDKHYYMFAGLPGTFLEYKSRFDYIDESVFEKLSAIFEVIIKYKKKYFKPTSPLAIVEVFDSSGNSIYCKEEKNN